MRPLVPATALLALAAALPQPASADDQPFVLPGDDPVGDTVNGFPGAFGQDLIGASIAMNTNGTISFRWSASELPRSSTEAPSSPTDGPSAWGPSRRTPTIPPPAGS